MRLYQSYGGGRRGGGGLAVGLGPAQATGWLLIPLDIAVPLDSDILRAGLAVAVICGMVGVAVCAPVVDAGFTLADPSLLLADRTVDLMYTLKVTGARTASALPVAVDMGGAKLPAAVTLEDVDLLLPDPHGAPLVEDVHRPGKQVRRVFAIGIFKGEGDVGVRSAHYAVGSGGPVGLLGDVKPLVEGVDFHLVVEVLRGPVGLDLLILMHGLVFLRGVLTQGLHTNLPAGHIHDDDLRPLNIPGQRGPSYSMRKSGQDFGMVDINRLFCRLGGEPQHDAVAIATLRPVSGDHVERPVAFVQGVYSRVHLGRRHLMRRGVTVESEDPQL